MAQLHREAGTHEQPQLTQDPSQYHNIQAKLTGHASHDQFCDAIHENVLNSEVTRREISTLSLQEMGRPHNSSTPSTKNVVQPK